MTVKLKYGNTNTFFIRGTHGGLLLDTDFAGTLHQFYREIKKNGISVQEITYVLATHYHPDHMGLISELAQLGIRLLIVDTQLPYIHFSDEIFKRDNRLTISPTIQEEKATVIGCAESRGFLEQLGICGEIIYTPSHSQDSISLMLDNGECFVGDLEPADYIDGYDENVALKKDWKNINSFSPRVIHYGHANDKEIDDE